jgi:hypothetical protein
MQPFGGREVKNALGVDEQHRNCASAHQESRIQRKAGDREQSLERVPAWANLSALDPGHYGLGCSSPAGHFSLVQAGGGTRGPQELS